MFSGSQVPGSARGAPGRGGRAEEEEEDEDPGAEEGEQMIQVDPTLLRRTNGWLTKKGGVVHGKGRHNWKRRYFVMKHQTTHPSESLELFYFARPQDSAPKGRVILDDAEVMCEEKKHRNKEAKFDFQILLKNGAVLELYASTAEERDEWVQSLNMVIAVHRRRRQAMQRSHADEYNPEFEDDENNYQLGEDMAQNCEVFGPGLYGAVAGQRGVFTIQTNDARGQPMHRGGMPFTARLENDDLLYHLKVYDHRNGSYTGQYITSAPGTYNLSILLNDEHHIYGSPFSLKISTATTEPRFCTAEGEALTELVPEERMSFKITARDKFGTQQPSGGDAFEVGIMGPALLRSLEDNGDGTYTCSMEASAPPDVDGNRGTDGSLLAAGPIQVLVTLNGKHIAGSPFMPEVSRAAIAKHMQQRAEEKRAREVAAAKAKEAERVQERQRQENENKRQQSLLEEQQRHQEQLRRARELQNAAFGGPAGDGGIAGPGIDADSYLYPTGMQAGNQEGGGSRLQRARERAMRAKAAGGGGGPPPMQGVGANNQFMQPPQQQQQRHQQAPLGTGLGTGPDPSRVAVALQGGGVAVGPEAGGQDDEASVNTTGSRLQDLAKRAKTRGDIQYGETTGRSSPANFAQKTPFAGAVALEQQAPSPTAAAPAETLHFALPPRMDSSPDDLADVEANMWNMCIVALQDKDVLHRLTECRAELAQVFLYYSENSNSAQPEAGTMPMTSDSASDSHGGLLQMIRDYDISPTYMSRRDVRKAFGVVARICECGGDQSINFRAFADILLLIAVFSLSKPSYASLYRTNLEQLEVLLSSWGVAQSMKLSMIQSSS